jgi:serine/threonine protein kinase
MAFLTRLKSLFAARRLDVRSRFELLREAISGTMSKFYMARDRQTGEVVGLKILDLDKTETFEARFKGLRKPTEGAIAVQFFHPYIVRTLEHGRTAQGNQYLVMEYLDGPGINSVLIAKDSRLEGQRVKYIKQIAEALAAVHRAGFIHRDVCPRNLLLTGDWETLKLTDFGLTVPAKPPFMRSGNRTGTPNYMAPELVRRRPTDQRLDVFSFGVTAYEICTRELPWARGSTGMAALAHEQAPTNIFKYRPQIDPKLAEAIHSCIEPDIKERFPSMEDFLRKIRRVQHEDS